MELINNVNKTLRDDIIAQMKAGSRLSIAASCFSIYAFQELKSALKDIKELRFIFTSPTFTTEKTPKQQREFYIPRLDRERTLYGSEFEVKLRNELTQRAIARECADWIKEKACFKSNTTNEQMMGFINLDDTNYSPIDGFTTVDLGCEKGNSAYTMIQKAEAPFSQAYIDLFSFTGEDTMHITLRMGQLSHNLMLEEYPASAGCFSMAADGRWIFQADVCSYLGIGRFVLGLYDDIEILGDDGLKQYVTGKLQQWHTCLSSSLAAPKQQ